MILLSILLLYSLQKKFQIKNFEIDEFLKISGIIGRAFLSTMSPSLPKCYQMRFILGLWFVSCVFINARIQTNFIAALTKPGIEEEISTQEELLHSNLNKSISISYKI